MVEECTENVDELKIARITLAENANKHKCSSCTLYIVLFSIIFTINVGIGTYFVYYKYINHNKETDPKKIIFFRQQLLDVVLLNLQMRSIKEINIKNQTYYLFDDMINLKNFNSSLIKIDKKSYKDIDIDDIGYIIVKDSDYVKINSVNPLYLITDSATGHCKEKTMKDT